MRRRVLCALVTISLAATALPLTASSPTAQADTTPQAAAAAPVTLGRSSITWKKCADESLRGDGAECAMLKVPLDYAKPKGTKIELALSRVKHTVAANKYQGPILVNPGGPGGSGLIYSTLGSGVPNNAGDAYDWIGFDPRGVGSSKPAVSCQPTYAGFNRPDYRPWTPALYSAWSKKSRSYTTACDKKNGAILDHLTTADSAKDMESIRKALGAPVINYYGFSYGTYLGQVYATLYPSKLRRAVFDGTVDPSRIWYGANLDQDLAFNTNINIWFGWLARYNSTYHLGTTEAAVKKKFYDTQERLYAKPVKGENGKLGGSEWIDAFLYAGYYQLTWLDLGQKFSDFVNKKDVAALESAYLDASGYGDDNGYAIYDGVQCTDVKWPLSWERWSKDSWRTWAKAPYETWGNTWYNEPCRHWPAKSHKAIGVKDNGVASILMVNETLDAATPYSGSLEVRRRFKGARLIAEPGGTTHAGSLGGNTCVDNKIASYLASGALPARKSGNVADTTCAPLPQPNPDEASAQRKTGAAASAAELKKLLIKAIGHP